MQPVVRLNHLNVNAARHRIRDQLNVLQLVGNDPSKRLHKGALCVVEQKRGKIELNRLRVKHFVQTQYQVEVLARVLIDIV